MTHPRRPVTVSLTSANAEFNRWVEENGYFHLKDKRGHDWRLESQLELLPHPERLQGTLYRLYVQLSSTISSESLVKDGVCHPVEDQRLLTLFAGHTLPIQLRRMLHEADSLDKLRQRMGEDLIKIKEFVRSKDFSNLFRSSVGRWVDQNRMVTYHLTEAPQIKINLEI